MTPAVIQLCASIDVVIDTGHEKIWMEEQQGSMKSRRRHTDHCVRMFIDQDVLSNYAAVIVKMCMPVLVGEHDVGRAVWAVFIGGVKETSEIRLQFQAIEKVAACFLDPRA